MSIKSINTLIKVKEKPRDKGVLYTVKHCSLITHFWSKEIPIIES